MKTKFYSSIENGSWEISTPWIAFGKIKNTYCLSIGVIIGIVSFWFGNKESLKEI